MFNERPIQCRRCVLWPVWGIFFLNAAGSSLAQQGGITNEGPLTVFRTGTNESLLTFSLPFDVPPTNVVPRLEFDFGFATDEPDAAGTFFDSFSATLQDNEQSATALLLTADRTGVQWAPANPGGVTLSSNDIDRAVAPFANVNPRLAMLFSFSVGYLLPPEFSGRAITLFFDFFDNLNQFASLAYVRDVRIETSAIAPPAIPNLQSSASVAGPFADESGVSIDISNRLMTLPQFGRARFFRLRSDLPALINRLRIEGEQLIFEYAFQPKILILQSAPLVEGPYLDETNAVLDVSAQTISVIESGGTRFFRIRSDPQAVISRLEAVGDRLVLHFEFQPGFVALQSSAAAGGPYAEESGVVAESADRVLKISKSGQARFYRIRFDQTTHIVNLTLGNGALVFHYE